MPETVPPNKIVQPDVPVTTPTNAEVQPQPVSQEIFAASYAPYHDVLGILAISSLGLSPICFLFGFSLETGRAPIYDFIYLMCWVFFLLSFLLGILGSHVAKRHHHKSSLSTFSWVLPAVTAGPILGVVAIRIIYEIFV